MVGSYKMNVHFPQHCYVDHILTICKFKIKRYGHRKFTIPPSPIRVNTKITHCTNYKPPIVLFQRNYTGYRSSQGDMGRPKQRTKKSAAISHL